ncbi:COP9 signalosome [Abortiporus biennis]|nr:COP9 signalosome [Abortiporus biennis]
MTGPPTPPPSSDLEIKDAARLEAPVPPPPATAPPPVAAPAEPQTVQPPRQTQTQYDIFFPTLENYASNGQLDQLVAEAEKADLTVDGDSNISRLLVTTPLVLSYLILNELPAARFALERLPENLKANILPQALFSLLSSVWERKYEKIYPKAEELYNIVQQPVIPSQDLASVAAPLVKTFIDTFRRTTFVLLSKAFSSIPLASAQTYLGFTAEQVLAAAQEQNWSYDANTHVLSPTLSISSDLHGLISGSSSLQTFTLVANSDLGN